jgi:predicted Zn-ribbon and HTH transcriptional regulator
MKQCVVCEQPIAGQQQKYCSNACKQKDHYHRVKAQTNTYHSQTLRSLRRKVQLIELFGGGCRKCGYNANVAALHFHHSDPNLKSMKLDMRVLSNRNWESIMAEAGKCELLCSNCHAEEHHPELALQTIQRMFSGASRQETTG